MRYEKGHKEATRRRIVKTAAARFRHDGIEGVGLADLMAEAGLTHGGFYSHFASKEALVQAAMEEAAAHSRERFKHRIEEGGLEKWIRSYLSPEHRDHPERGCAAATLAAELARHPKATRRSFTDNLIKLRPAIEAQLPKGMPAAVKRQRAVGIFSSLIGAMQLSRAVADPELSDEILQAGIASALALTHFESPISKDQNDRTPAGKSPERAGPKEGPSAAVARRVTWAHKAGLGIVAALLVVAGVTAYLIHVSHHETTDDAYTTGHVHNISSRVAGTVVEVAVDDNQFVRKGQILARLDPRDFQVQVDKAQADFDRSKADFDRVDALHKSFNGDVAISKEEYDQMKANVGVAKAALQDAVDQLSYTTITAPEDGFVGDKTVETGNRVAVGTVLMSVVQDVWVVANFKETQVGKMAKGQKVGVVVDEIAGHTFSGTVDSFSPGSGSVFALLPPENATGNFTKIVQRVPVKIRFDAASIRGYESRLVPGLSVEADVRLSRLTAAGKSPSQDGPR